MQHLTNKCTCWVLTDHSTQLLKYLYVAHSTKVTIVMTGIIRKHWQKLFCHPVICLCNKKIFFYCTNCWNDYINYYNFTSII